jgi:hypothetical protein
MEPDYESLWKRMQGILWEAGSDEEAIKQIRELSNQQIVSIREKKTIIKEGWQSG